MSGAYVVEETRHLISPIPGVRFTFEGIHRGYAARCDECNLESFHAIGLEPWPNAAALDDADLHNDECHP